MIVNYRNWVLGNFRRFKHIKNIISVKKKGVQQAVNVILKPKDPQALYPTDILFQTIYWGAVKKHLGWKTYAFDVDGSKPEKDLLVLAKSIGRNTVGLYVPQGPEFAPEPEEYGPYLESMSESLMTQIEEEIAFIRYDLPWESSYAHEIEKCQRYDYPDPRIREIRMNFGTRNWKLKKAPVDMTVAHSCLVDIEGDESQLLSRMKPKTRYNIGLAHRKGVRVSACSVEKLPVFYDLYRQTAQRNDFRMSKYRFFEALFSAHKKHRGNSEIFLLLATHGRDALAGAIIAISHKGALFLHGASADIKRNYMGSYALHWKAIQCARAYDCRVYDMGAVSPVADPQYTFYGLYLFKSGFGGRIVHNSGTWDFPVDENIYLAFRNWETTWVDN